MKSAYFTMNIVPAEIMENEEFKNVINFYTLEFQEVCRKDNKGLFLGIIKNDNLLFASDTIPSIFQAFAQYNPTCIGVTDIEGIPFGMTRTITPAIYDEDGNILTDKDGNILTDEIVNYSGEMHFPFNIQELMSMLPPKIENVFDENGELIETIEVPHTEPYLPLIPSGWKKPNWEELSKLL